MSARVCVIENSSSGELSVCSRLHGLITDTSKLQSYVDRALVPWVRAVKDHPALGGWDIINEMEGFIQPGHHDSEPCFDTTFLAGSGAGWTGATYTARQLLRWEGMGPVL